ncbi:MAG: SLATT domain-containing protein [Ginsengibacter sp.]
MSYDWTKPNETLEVIKGNILSSMKAEENWYAKHRWWHSVYSRGIRVIAIILFAFGILWPILSANMKLDEKPEVDIGYISLAIGGLLLLLDKYLGISSGYVRFYIAELDIKKNTQDFIENWDVETAKSGNPMTTENVLALLNIVKQFRQSVFTTIQVETGAWATEFQTQTGELYELFKQKQSESVKPANISVTVENFSGYSDIEVGIDNETSVKLGTMTSIIFRNVSIQPHLIKIRATKEDKSIVTFSKNVDVTADKTSEVSLSLP